MAFGLRPVRMYNGAAWAGNVVACIIPSSDSANRFVGDPVIMGAAGESLTSYTGPNLDGTYPQIDIAVGTGGTVSKLFGAIVGFDPVRGELEKQYGPASTTRVAYVAHGTDVVFQSEEDGAVDPLTLADIGQAADLIAGAGSTATGFSGWTIDSSSPTTSGQVRLIGLANTPGNTALIDAASSPWPVWEVLINEPQVFPTALGAVS